MPVSIEERLEDAVLVLDGAMGTALQDLKLSPNDFGGPDLLGCNENLVRTRPDAVRAIHESYLRAGADIVETNTFGGTPLVLGEYGLADRAREINRLAARIAREAASKFSTPEKPRYVAGALGPTTKAISVTGGIGFEELARHFEIQAAGLLEGGVDYLLVETCQDTRNIKAALIGIDEAQRVTGISKPIAVSATIEATGTMLAGQGVEALVAALEHRELLYLGLNCATGPEFMTDPIRTLARVSPFRVACVPNAGLPDSTGCYLETPEMVSSVIARFLENGWLNLVGGCCGTHAGHIESLARAVAHARPRPRGIRRGTWLSGIDALEVTEELRPILVGERTNVIGSRKFKDLVSSGKWDEAAEVGRGQVRSGAQVVDVCLANPDRDERDDMRRFLDRASRMIRAPLMIDSTDDRVIALALTYSQGKAVINSINLEDGEERFDKVVPLAKRFGAALVVGTIDDDPVQGMGITRERKLAIAEREFALLTGKHGIRPEDIFWDPLVFPVGTGDEQYLGSAVETIEALKLLKARFRGTRTLLGVSNVSFGLPPAGREVLNSVFLYHCVRAGLDFAIVNSEKLERYASIPEDHRKLAEKLLFHRRGDAGDPVAEFSAAFRDAKARAKAPAADLPLDERLARHIIEGTREGLAANLEEALRTMAPLAIINGPLMRGMDEVGRLFNANQLIVAEVLQSAESMKAAVACLEPKMEKGAAAKRGKVLLATVKGDVHDIGKNLVEIILSNNGFEVLNLGIKVPPERILAAIREEKPDLIGLSGLLVKSAQMMVLTGEDLTRGGATPPMLVGGAALTEAFTDRQIAPAYGGLVAYAKDAMAGLDLAKRIVDPRARAELAQQVSARRASQAAASPGAVARASPAPTKRAARILDAVPALPDTERRVLWSTPIEKIWAYINPLMLYGRHLGIPGGVVRKLVAASQGDRAARAELEVADPRALKIWELVEEVQAEYRRTPFMKPAAVYRFFPARGNGNRIVIGRGPGERSLELPRQPGTGGLGLADYLHPESDSIAFFVTSVGVGVREEAERLKLAGEYLRSHILHSLAFESAEAYAELLHAQIRHAWGFPDPPEMSAMERFQAKYRGKRYSFGYPACPRLDDQSLIFDLLRPEEIGVKLTEGFMMDPEASVSALAIHHPDAVYFSVGSGGENRF